MVTNEAIPQHRLLFITCALFKFRVHQHAPCTSFQFLKRGESLTYDIGESLTPFEEKEASSRRMLLNRRRSKLSPVFALVRRWHPVLLAMLSSVDGQEFLGQWYKSSLRVAVLPEWFEARVAQMPRSCCQPTSIRIRPS